MKNVNLFIEKYYHHKIQLSKSLIYEVLKRTLNKNKKILIFGLGYDSYLWYKSNNKKNIIFVEHNDSFINLNSKIKNNFILKYEYKNTSVEKSLKNIFNEDEHLIPAKLLRKAPFDIVLIDSPEGYKDDSFGREIPFYWTRNFLIHEKTKIFIHDIQRKLEKLLLEKYFKDFQKKYFHSDKNSVLVTY